MKKLGRYELVEPLGQGGMGEVWLARLSGAGGFEKPAIVKTVLPALAKDEQFVQRFHHEGKVLVHLSHSNIAQVYDMDQADGVLFMALEYVAGVDVSRLVSQVASQDELIPVPVAVFIAWQAAEGLSYAHHKVAPDGTALAIVHRDVSPQNVMVGYEGEVKVIDFGIARSAARSHSTQAAMVMGKLGYMAPEQAMAEPVDARADQYALAVLLWELLAGKHYVAAATPPEMMVAMAQPKRQPLAPLRSEVEPSLEAVVQKALSRRPEDRYPTTDDFSRALLAELGHLGQPTRKQVGDWVKLKCGEAYETNQRLLSRLSTFSKHVTVTTKGRPAMVNAPLNTDAAVSAMLPNRIPLILGGVLVALAVACGIWFLRPVFGDDPPLLVPPPVARPEQLPAVPVVPPLAVEAAVPDAGQPVSFSAGRTAPVFVDGEKTLARAGSEDGLKVGVELKVVGAQSNDGKHPLLGAATVLEVFPKMARLSLDAAAARAPGEKWVALDGPKAAEVKPPTEKKPAPGVKVALNATLALVQLPRRAVRLKNNGGFTLTRCSVFIPGQRQADFASLPAGMAREIVLEQFSVSPSAPALDNEVKLSCAQGSITLPAQ